MASSAVDVMRLLHVYSGNLFGGIEAILVSLAKHAGVCPALKHEFALCFEGRLTRELEALGASVHRLGPVRVSRPLSVRRARRRLAALIATNRFDRVVCHGPWSLALFGAIPRRIRIPLVFWVHDAAAGVHWTERWARRTEPDLAICNSHYTARTLPSLYAGVPLAVVYAPIDVNITCATSAEREAARAELRTRPDAVVIVQASRMQAWKGHQVLLDALGRLRHRPEWTLWVVGGAQRESEAPYVESLTQSARSLDIADRVRWVGQRDDVPRLLSAADVLCQPNVTPEPFGITYVEALAAGLPVVASGVGGATEIVDDSCGVLVPPGDPTALAAGLEQLIADTSCRARLAANARARAQSISDPAAQLLQLAQVLATSPAGVAV